jgi:NAD-dependent dihydropyrimidine dehydrogenase PreA subunit
VTGTNTLTLGGLLLALIILVCNLYPWYRGGREMSKLAMFGKGNAAGICMAMCPGGILGWAHSRSGTVGNGVGERTGTALTGTGNTQGLTTGQLVGLGATGAVIVVLVVLVVGLAYKEAGRKDKRRIIGGVYVGSTLCLTAGVAGALAWVPTAFNAAGDGVVGFFQGAGLL